MRAAGVLPFPSSSSSKKEAPKPKLWALAPTNRQPAWPTSHEMADAKTNHMNKFTVIPEQDEDGVWISECPSIPGCISQGKTRIDAIANIREAIRLCREVRAEREMASNIETLQLEIAA
uniref:Predicted nuclease of the RNAse H fold, HicB family n=1 Tax=Candidatus Kentrum sp. MB TaxID=2138164 RepID=A0A450XQ92_9GAMM|nr:MAG: Predicted nuclease of the RNAse H fold, HicB family [Candidatus Kentron sp. MB]VFK34714.1 MAG: Predicted nuclease of the RNAse H fold, HicB family [Candidatus Kentron sp. MB]VFK76961.1 MAG: Predicted nuclease of the RNAse H fold, HicB family [Candidatus Kentron sp. MB]